MKITDLRKKVQIGANPLPGNVVLLDEQKTLFMYTEHGFFNVMTGQKFPYTYKEICEVRDVVLHDNIIETVGYMLANTK